MKRLAILLAALGGCLVSGVAQSAKPVAPAPAVAARVAPAPPPPEKKPRNETLQFNVNWPSGLSLGEGQLTASQTPEGWSFSMKVDASIPAFRITEAARSRTSADLCTLELHKEANRGSRTLEETTKFDASALTATRQTGKGGGKSEIRTSACAKDALAFLQFVRNELIAGRVPGAQQVFYGAPYQTRLQYVGAQRITSSGEAQDADKLTAFIKGPASEFSVDLFFARDEHRTPLQAVVPVPIGKLTVEFIR